MLEGLEISEVMLSYAKKNNDVFRIDSTYFQKEFLLEENLIRKKGFKTLHQLENSILSFGAYSLTNQIEYLDEGVPYIRGVNMKKGRIDFMDTAYISTTANSLLWKSEVKPETILLSMSGTIGDVAIASPNWKYPINSNQDIAKIHVSPKLNAYYLFVFLLSKFGQNYLHREARGSVQQHVFLSQIEQFEIPLLDDRFIAKIEVLVRGFDEIAEAANSAYAQAEALLLSEIGMHDFEPSREAVNIKSFSGSFGTTGRLDAEYYQKKYEDYERLILSYPQGVKSLAAACFIQDENFNPAEKTLYQYIELSNIGKSGEISGCTEALGSELPSRARRQVFAGDVILSSIEGSLQSCAVVPAAYDGALCSTGFYVIRSQKLNPETLLVLFKSEPMQALLKQRCSGTILTAINKEVFSAIPVPLISYEKQQEIAAFVTESFRLRAESERLLSLAKTAVEKAIEEDEAAAMEFIENKC